MAAPAPGGRLLYGSPMRCAVLAAKVESPPPAAERGGRTASERQRHCGYAQQALRAKSAAIAAIAEVSARCSTHHRPVAPLLAVAGAAHRHMLPSCANVNNVFLYTRCHSWPLLAASPLLCHRLAQGPGR